MKLMAKERDPYSGVITEWYAKPDGNVYIRKYIDAQNVVNQNKKLQNEHNGLYGDTHRVASVPVLLMEQWAREAGMSMFSKEFDGVLKRKLNDPDYKYLKTVNGTI